MSAHDKERQLLALIRARDADLELARTDIDDQNHLLRSAKAAIERLQDGLGEVRADNSVLKAQIQKVIQCSIACMTPSLLCSCYLSLVIWCMLSECHPVMHAPQAIWSKSGTYY